MTCHQDYSLLSHNTFGMDVRAKHFVEYQTEEELLQLISRLPADEPLLHIGAGSNLLFRGDYPGTILHSAIRGIEQVGEDKDHVLLRVGASVVWDDFVAYTVGRGLGGAENLSLIPGEVGASAVQNIGAYGAEVGDIVTRVEAIHLRTGQKHSFGNADLGYAYRQSIFKQRLRGQYAITHVTYSLSKHPCLNLDYGGLRSYLSAASSPTTLSPGLPPSSPSGDALLCGADVSSVRQAVISIRQAKLPDPKRLGNAGSFFMNPVVSEARFQALRQQYPDMPHYPAPDGIKVPAGWLIEQCGWKGRSLGQAAVHENQALVLVNLGGATPDEILHLCQAISNSVRDKFDIDIQPEVNLV